MHKTRLSSAGHADADGMTYLQAYAAPPVTQLSQQQGHAASHEQAAPAAVSTAPSHLQQHTPDTKVRSPSAVALGLLAVRPAGSACLA